MRIFNLVTGEIRCISLVISPFFFFLITVRVSVFLVFGNFFEKSNR